MKQYTSVTYTSELGPGSEASAYNLKVQKKKKQETDKMKKKIKHENQIRKAL